MWTNVSPCRLRSTSSSSPILNISGAPLPGREWGLAVPAKTVTQHGGQDESLVPPFQRGGVSLSYTHLRTLILDLNATRHPPA